MRKLRSFSTRKVLVLLLITAILLVTAILPFIPGAVELSGFRTTKEQLFPVYENTGFENVLDGVVSSWNLINGSKISRTMVYEGNMGINMTPSTPINIPQIIYSGKNATTRYIVGGNLVFSFAARTTKTPFGTIPSYIAMETIVFHHGKTNVTAFFLDLVLYKRMENITNGATSTKHRVLLYKNLPESDEWIEYSLQISSLTGLFSEYLRKWRGIDASPSDKYEVVGLTIWCENLVAYVDKVSFYLVEPKHVFITVKSNSIIPMNMFISQITVNGTITQSLSVKPEFVAPFTSFEIETYVPYIPLNGSNNYVSIRFGSGHLVQFNFVERTERIWLTF
ncbi:MAG: hypothetical protein QXJ17_01265 [Nitrososphaeria archaeon]